MTLLGFSVDESDCDYSKLDTVPNTGMLVERGTGLCNGVFVVE